MSYDQKCHDLAMHFLQDCTGWDQDDAKLLAEDIQAAVEDFFSLHEEAIREIRKP